MSHANMSNVEVATEEVSADSGLCGSMKSEMAGEDMLISEKRRL